MARTKTTTGAQKAFAAARKEASAYIAEQKRRAATRRRVWDYPTLYRAAGLVAEYVQDCRQDHRPITVAGMILASGVGRSTWARICRGELDYHLEAFRDSFAPGQIINRDGLEFVRGDDGQELPLIKPSELMDQFYLMMQQQAEERLYSEKGKVTDIFTMKAVFKWEDQPTAISDNRHQTLVIASAEEAQKAISLLK